MSKVRLAIIGNGTSGAGVNHLLLTVDGDSAFADQNFDAVFLVEAFAHQRQLFGGVVREVRREVYAWRT